MSISGFFLRQLGEWILQIWTFFSIVVSLKDDCWKICDLTEQLDVPISETSCHFVRFVT
jgi:hypothetical protein